MKIAIITVCRNDIRGLKKTFDSLCSQDSDTFEWWVIDGDSGDGTVAWLRKNHKFGGGWISEPDDGIYDAMNKGIGLAAGDYLLFLNSGDTFAGADVMVKLRGVIEREKAAPDFVYGDSLDVEENGKSYYRKALPVSYIKAGMITRHQAMLYRKECIFNERYPSNFKLSGDYALTAGLVTKNTTKVLKVNFPICLFSLGGAHDTRRTKALQEDFQIRKTILKENIIICLLLFCVHLLHNYLRKIIPSVNKKIIYKS